MSAERVRLRVPIADDVELLDRWEASADFRGEFNDFGLPHTSAGERVARASSTN